MPRRLNTLGQADVARLKLVTHTITADKPP